MKLLLAQGNPGANYARTRHNAGWIIIDTLAETFGATWKSSGKFNALLAEVNLHGQKVILAKPLTFYNETGQVARSLADFYSLDPSNDLLVLHDELALPFGAVRVRQKGSDAGNNGIKSLNSHLGQEYWRIRIGIWSELRNRMDDSSFVLSRFTTDELASLQHLAQNPIAQLVEDFLNGEMAHSSYTAST
ncbi:TPA: aminoacyl-tRNA hydrolase [Candidatus Saccharibacteria bacterium]|nr:aminoacyl-tRNA hydrolase [Candidatus Saccharibacteria bacterium]|tara:strand:- start:539 stop:1108 length:570 start_codon:yes stop_codon:yes gene_type:complete